MFVGHYALGFYLKKRNNSVPLWLILLGVQLVDLFWAIFIALGIERASYNAEASVFLRPLYEYYPYTHSLFTNVTIALFVAILVYRFINRKWATIAGIAVLSHWFLDLIVHVPDVPLFFDSFKVGLGLWNFPVISLLFELLLLTAAFWYLKRDIESVRTRKWIWGIYLFLAIFYFASFFAPAVEPTTIQLGIFGLLIYGGIPAVAYFAERMKYSKKGV
jgi:hypothetical protein